MNTHPTQDHEDFEDQQRSIAMSDRNRYDVVPAQLPAELPALTRANAERVRDALVAQFFHGNQLSPPWWVTRDVRRVWLSPKPTRASNSDKGLGRLIHDVSHAWFGRVYPHKRAHDPLHVVYERDVAAYVAANLTRLVKPPKIKAKPTARERGVNRLEQVLASLGRWQSKERRAQNAIKKLNRERARLGARGYYN